jgi:hypothetical protein
MKMRRTIKNHKKQKIKIKMKHKKKKKKKEKKTYVLTYAARCSVVGNRLFRLQKILTR